MEKYMYNRVRKRRNELNIGFNNLKRTLKISSQKLYNIEVNYLSIDHILRRKIAECLYTQPELIFFPYDLARLKLYMELKGNKDV